MNTINYFRVLMEAQCLNCDWKGHDADCEHYTQVEKAPGEFWMEMINVCPLCNSSNIIIESWPKPTVLHYD